MVELFARLTSNENDWVLPSGHGWNARYQGNPNIAYEKQYGFGHEEWLLNPRFNVDGLQYGHIRSLEKTNFHNNRKIDVVHFYAFWDINGKSVPYYVGNILNIELLGSENFLKLGNKIKSVLSSSYNDSISEVRECGGDSSGMRRSTFLPFLRFSLKDVNFFDEPIWLENFPIRKYKRYQAHRLSLLPSNYFNHFNLVNEPANFTFMHGKARPSESYKRQTSKSERSVYKFHTKILNELEKHLLPAFSLSQKNISIEKQSFDGCIADIVLWNNDHSISIFEAKTNTNCRRNIREAVGQLLDYASHCKRKVIRKLVIVSPADLKGRDLNFFNNLNSRIEYSLEYLYYTGNQENSFIKYG